jgi:hypothetical protein
MAAKAATQASCNIGSRTKAEEQLCVCNDLSQLMLAWVAAFAAMTKI